MAGRYPKPELKRIDNRLLELEGLYPHAKNHTIGEIMRAEGFMSTTPGVPISDGTIGSHRSYLRNPGSKEKHRLAATAKAEKRKQEAQAAISDAFKAVHLAPPAQVQVVVAGKDTEQSWVDSCDKIIHSTLSITEKQKILKAVYC